ncbi:hypothetical protein [Rhodohalobacter sp. SW132]|uniref:hypothetical protein n=1 Tax=Rhodohalobacter sp. SW132 TaxID=2293433 RepID=UPI0011C02498|nr:hypothetical protein [Rhodohalobacter sp. SW132]
MIAIKIGTADRRDGDIDARWITDQVNARRREGKKICVLFKVNCGDVNLNLPSRDYPKAGGGGRKPNVNEEFILDEWRKMGFPDQNLNPGMVVSFWEFVKQICD